MVVLSLSEHPVMGRRRLSGKSPPLVSISPWDRTLPLYPHMGYYPLGILSLPLILYIVYG